MKRALLLAAIAVAAVSGPALADVKAGIEAWQRGDFAAAVKAWEPDAAAGDPDAQFNLGQAYKLGKGVPVDMVKAQSWYKKAADQGHDQALANYGLIMFQSGKRTEALPWLQKAADRGEPRAQYVVGTSLFNGDFGSKDWPRAYAYMSAAAAAGLPQASASVVQMDKYIPEADRAKGLQIAQGLGKATPVVDSLAAAQAMRTSGPVRPGIEASPIPPSQPALAERTPPPAPKPKPLPAAKPAPMPKPAPAPTQVAVATPKPPVSAPTQIAAATPLPEARPAPAPKPTPAPKPVAEPKPVPAPKPTPEPKHIRVAEAVSAPTPTAGGKWRIQLGAYSSGAAASAAWSKVSGKLPGFGRLTSSAGAMTRLQTGPFASKAAAVKACGAAKSSGLACLPVPAP